MLQLNTAYSAEAHSRGSEPTSTSGRVSDGVSGKDTKSGPNDSSKPNKADGTGRGGAKAGKPSSPTAPSFASSSTPAPNAPAAEAAASSHLAPSRLAVYARTILHRELMLKLQPRSYDALPRLLTIEASITAIETQLEKDLVDKSDLLLYALALEALAGRPATYTAPANKHMGTRASGVAVSLDAQRDPDAAYGFLEKLVHVILPNQVGFEGIAPPTLVVPPKRGKGAEEAMLRQAAKDHRRAPLRPHSTAFKVGSLLQYPDFEQTFALFEPLTGMRVRLVVEGASAADCTALLGGLALPLLSGPAADAALAEVAAEAARKARA